MISLRPFSILTQAIKVVPATKYALAVGGIIAVVAIIIGFKINLWVATLGAVVMLVLMTVFVDFASLAVHSEQNRAGGTFRHQIIVFTLVRLLLIIAVWPVLFFSGV